MPWNYEYDLNISPTGVQFKLFYRFLKIKIKIEIIEFIIIIKNDKKWTIYSIISNLFINKILYFNNLEIEYLHIYEFNQKLPNISFFIINLNIISSVSCRTLKYKKHNKLLTSFTFLTKWNKI